jgi:diaminohydroxyphosphoribosylaminopyrimidine deaminase / 5-amino-6-(5-phosphoribosylamino)uracil reductase
VLRDHPRLLPEKIGDFVPWRIVLDPRARLSGTEKVFQDRFSHRTIWLAGPSLSPRRRRTAWNAGSEVVNLKARDFDGFVREAVRWMAARPLRRVMVEGGGQTLGAFLRVNMADELVLYSAPRLLGGDRSLGIFGGPGPKTLEFLPVLKIVETATLGGDLKVRAHVFRHH